MSADTEPEIPEWVPGETEVLAQDPQGACILTEADILAGRDDDCTTHDHEESS